MSLQYLKKEVRDEVDFLHVDNHQSFLQVDFNTLDIKDAYKVILSLLQGMIKHSQSTQSNRFANIFTISQKRRYEGSSFFACTWTSKFLQLGIIVFDGSDQILRGSSLFIVNCLLLWVLAKVLSIKIQLRKVPMFLSYFLQKTACFQKSGSWVMDQKPQNKSECRIL